MKISKEITHSLMGILKLIKSNIKNINPIRHSSDSNENILITKYAPEEKEQLEEFIKSAFTPEQKSKFSYSISEETLICTFQSLTYEEILKTMLPEELTSIPTGFEIVGKIAHFNLRDEYLKYKYVVGQLIMDKNPSIRTVVTKISKIDNVFRTYQMEVIAGKNDFSVEHKEGNCTFVFNLRDVYWSSRLQGERDRVLGIMKKNEVLCDAFCGVGPLSIRACKKGIRVLANDLNPHCYDYINKNVLKNKLDKKLITTFNTDAREFIRTCINKTKHIINNEEDNIDLKYPIDLRIDHFYMNLPKDAIEFMDVFVGLFVGCKENIYNKDNLPIVHVYGFAKTEENPHEELLKRIAKAFGMGYSDFTALCNKNVLHIENVRDISNKKVVYCIDIKIPSVVAYSTTISK